MKEHSNEFKLLLEASQVSPSSEIIYTLLNKKMNKPYLFSLAQGNGVIPLVNNKLEKYTEFNQYEDFKKAALDIKKRNFFMSAQLLYIIDLLNDINITIIPLKGPLLSQHAYNDISLRPFSDLDILVQEENLLAVAKLLLSLGYENEHALDILKHPYILKTSSDISFTHPHTNVIIELHWKLLKSASQGLSQINTLFKESIIIPFQNTKLHSLPLEEEFLYLCVHGAKHRFERIEWMNDVNQLYTLHKNDYDFDKLLQLATQEEYIIPYALALNILQEDYSQEILHEKTRLLVLKKEVDTLYHNVFKLHQQNYVLRDKKSGIRWVELLFTMGLEQSYFKKLILILKIVFPLYTNDILRQKELPKPLRFLYRLNRLKRQIKSVFKLQH